MQAIGRQPHRAPDGAPLHYERHRPEQTTLYRLVQQHAGTFFTQVDAATGASLPQNAQGRVRRLPRMRHPGPRLSEASLRRLRPRQAGRLHLEMFRTAIEDESNHNLLGKVRAKAYDAVINGIEVAGGSIRIHQSEVQALNFKALGLSPEKARERFGFFLEALEYGTPPHGGFAAGIERTLMALLQTDNIRDLIAFPKTASAQDLMMDSPGNVDDSQLKELGIKINESA